MLWMLSLYQFLYNPKESRRRKKTQSSLRPQPGILLLLPGTVLGWPGSSLGKGALWLLCVLQGHPFGSLFVFLLRWESCRDCTACISPSSVLASSLGLWNIGSSCPDNAQKMQSNTCDMKSLDEPEKEHLSEQEHPSFHVCFDKELQLLSYHCCDALSASSSIKARGKHKGVLRNKWIRL